jgi:hypothetical protein
MDVELLQSGVHWAHIHGDQDRSGELLTATKGMKGYQSCTG